MTLTWEGRIARIAEAPPPRQCASSRASWTSTEASRCCPRRSRTPTPRPTPAGPPCRPAPPAAARAFAAGLDDRLHEPYRPSVALDAIRADLPAGARGATLSGSGPTVIVWADDPKACAIVLSDRFPDHDVLELAVSQGGAP